MRTSAQIGSMVAAAVLAYSGAAHATDVYCPGTSYPAYTTALTPPSQVPTPTRYIDVSGGAYPGFCWYQNNNMVLSGGNSTLSTVISAGISAGFDLTNLALLGEIQGITAGTSVSGTTTPSPGVTYGVTSTAGGIDGTYSLDSSLWSSYSTLYIGFHFGNGSGNPDSFIIQLAQDNSSGNWSFNPASIANGISNFYLLGVPSGVTPPIGNTPEPASLGLVSLGILGAAFARKRRKA
ncbi:MAG: PEP-CTERM sorting domain-containing protein [Burkholderiales bacterium]|nr:PEP-CTERM sorting domain-containing protein [Burkholderiales bacterium]